MKKKGANKNLSGDLRQRVKNTSVPPPSPPSPPQPLPDINDQEEIALLAKFPAENPNPVLRIKSNGMIEYANPASTPVLEAFQCRVGEVLPNKWKKAIKDIYRSKNSRAVDLNHNDSVYSMTITPFTNTDFLYVYCHDITQLKQAEKEREMLLYDMGERVKELTCMYGVAKSIRERQTLDEVFHDVANLLPPGWQYPEITCGKIIFNKKEYLSKNYKKTKWKLAADIVVKGERQGTVEVYYTKKCPQLDEGPYLKEERYLINGVTRALSEAIERKEAEEELAEHRQHLEELVKERTAKLTKTNNLLKYEVTERKQAEDKLQEETKLKHVLLDNMPCIALLLRPKTREIIASNDEAANVGAVPGERCFATWGQRSDPCPWCLAPQVWATGERKHIEIEGVDKVWDASWIPISEDLYLHYAFDITEQKQIQRKIEELNTNLENRVLEEVEKSRQKDFIMIQQSRFAAMGEMIMYITHQWGQPLWALQLLLYNLNESIKNIGVKNKETDDMIGNGLKMINRMFTTMSDFKNFFQTNREKDIFSINKNIKDTLSLVGGSFKLRNISIILNEKKELTALGFPNEYSQVILNILKNSKDAIMEKGVKGEINIDFIYEDDSAIVRIKDNGGGIPDGILDKIFNSYFTTKTEYNGTGIGLYMSKVIICEHMNGSIKVQNTKDGAEFRIITPIVP